MYAGLWVWLILWLSTFHLRVRVITRCLAFAPMSVSLARTSLGQRATVKVMDVCMISEMDEREGGTGIA